ncbi:MAG: ABC transporter ATP-binding protein [Planctomycetes bacterium]|nr:ABC transporter ATP-binding protein [Planctomycetota bacterium]
MDRDRRWHDFRLLGRMAAFGWRYRARWLAMLGATAAVGGLTGALFFFMHLLLQALMGHPEKLAALLTMVGMQAPDAVSGMRGLGLVMLALSPVMGLLAYAAFYLGSWMGHRCMQDLRATFVAHLIELELAFHSQLTKGDLLTRLTGDLQTMQRIFATIYGKIMQRPAAAIGAIVSLFVIDWRAACVVIFLLLPMLATVGALLRRVRQRSRRARERMADNLAALEQITSGIRVIKAMGSSVAEGERYARANHRLFDASMRLARSRSVVDSLTSLAIFAITGSALVGGSWAISRGWITADKLFAFIGALGFATSNLRAGNRAWGDLQEALPSAERVFEILDRPSRIVDRPDAVDCPAPRSLIRLEGVHFAYGPGDEVLNRLDLDIPVGKTIALVGESGAGKSTILNLLPRFYDPTAGRVTIDGVDIRSFRQRSLVAKVAIVQQDSFLFDDTIAANIRYGRPEASDAEIETAARRAHLHDTIISLEGGLGYATPVGDRGERLSGGQRQRVAIARALLRDAPLLLLDEPTSALDADSERHIQEALGELMKGRTSVIIAHRLSTIRHADIIHVLGKGRGVIESGTHRELVERGGEYARLVSIQELR